MGSDTSTQKKLFEEFDSDGSGMIDSMEIASYIAENYTGFPLEAVQLLITLADRDGEKRIHRFLQDCISKCKLVRPRVKKCNLHSYVVAENNSKISGKRMQQVLKCFGVNGQIDKTSYDKAEFLKEISRFIPY
ncbi:EF-hand_domain pair [Hexamita inflata]|uniref:EF-hand domain pair n=1 Tax=Hexamita inflata TaxID=28002 RepID=A0AA86URV1_9EUKA|nr:EF-hand domain pair [Hexamita inflata]